mgnify:FL=1
MVAVTKLNDLTQIPEDHPLNQFSRVRDNEQTAQMAKLSTLHDKRFDDINKKLNQLLSIDGGDSKTNVIATRATTKQFTLNRNTTHLATVTLHEEGVYNVDVDLLELTKILLISFATIKFADYLLRKYVTNK